jgi:UDP-2-acetamido-2,6-beta-L-arabino-hexul-4-ose reductase
MLERAEYLADRYRSGVIPRFDDLFDLRLFNTYRSYLFPDYYPKRLELHSDVRGSLFEAVKTDHGGRPSIPRQDPALPAATTSTSTRWSDSWSFKAKP